MAGQILIKKYPNRRLYHTAERRYINLEDIEALVRADADIKVVDSTTNEDITRRILAQVMLSQVKDFDPILPVDFLKFLIKSSGTTSTWTDIMQGFFRMTPTQPPAWMDPFGFWKQLSPGAQPAGASYEPAAEPTPEPEPGPAAPSSSEADDLREKLEALQAQMSDLAAKLTDK